MTGPLPMHLLTYNYSAASPKYGVSYRVHSLAETWVKMGHEATIVGTSFSHLLKQPVEFEGPYLIEEVNGVRYVLLKVPHYKGSGVGRVRNFLAAMGQAKRHRKVILEHGRPDVVIASSVYQTDNYEAHRVARLTGAKFFRETRDLWPLTLIEIGGMSRRHPLVQFIQRAEDYGYRHADHVLTTLGGSKEYMVSHGLPQERWHYSPQAGPSDDTTESHELQNEFQRLKNEGWFVAIYAGSMGPVHDFDTVLGAAERVKDGKIAVVFLGEGTMKQGLVEAVQARGMPNVFFFGEVPRRCVRPLLQTCDVGLLALHDRPIYRYGISPNKLIDYSLAGLPHIIATNASTSLTAEAACGLVIQPADAGRMAQALIEVSQTPAAERAMLGRRGEEYVRTRHSIEAIAQQYLELARATTRP